MAAVLIVEDEPAMALPLAQALRESGLEVEVAENGSAGLRLAPGFDALIVDVMMPVMNGFEMVRQLRGAGHQTPVLFLTARDGLDDLVKGLELGGDDYLAKPFRLQELFARLEALLRRARAGQDELVFDDMVLDRRRRKASRAGKSMALSNTEVALLEQFMIRPNVVLAKAAILRAVWDGDDVRDDNIVEVFVRHLRLKLEVGERPRLIHTVRGQGYVLGSRAPKP